MLAAQDDMLGCTGAYQYIDPSIQTHAGLIKATTSGEGNKVPGGPIGGSIYDLD